MTSLVRLLRVLLGCFLALSLLGTLCADVKVKGYYRKDGTYVQPHTRSSPNKTKNDNYSTQGNINPYTGERGTKPRDDSSNQQTYSPKRTDEYAKRVGFSQVKAGMSAAQVVGFAGEPSMTRGSTWVYPDGWVEFSANNLVSRVTRDSSGPSPTPNVSVTGLSPSSPGDYQQTPPGKVWVNGYTRADGTKVQGHYRTTPNNTRNDNYSTKGNINPHTGKAGTKPRDGGASYSPSTHADGTPAYDRNQPARRAELKRIIATQDRIIDRYTKQVSFTTPEADRVTDEAYASAKEARRKAQLELDLMPQY